MITDEQRQQYKLKGYDIVFERNNRVFAVNSTNVKNWNSDKQEKFCDDTGLKLFTEEDGNPVFYDSDYFEVVTGSAAFSYLHYKALKESEIPQPINCHIMFSMFDNCASLQSLDLSNWDVSNVKDMSAMFADCASLRSLYFSGWDVSNVMDMQFMFYNCDSLQSLDLSNWDVSNVMDMQFMFSNCASLRSLDFSGWDVSNVKDMSSMFYNCASLQSLDLSNWDVSKFRFAHWMFDNCDSLIKTYGKSADELQNALINNQWPTLPNQGIKSSKKQPSKILF